MANQEGARGYEFYVEAVLPPSAAILPAEQTSVVGALVKLDGRGTVDPQRLALTYTWEFTQVPIGSQVERFGFSNLEDDSSVVTFAPDVIGRYEVSLVASNGQVDSDIALAEVDTRVILVPHHQGIVPDASFIWNYLSDFWNLVEKRRRFETFWSGAMQIVASELLSLYQIDYNKSIKDIQELFQKRWISYSPALELDPATVSFILADD